MKAILLVPAPGDHLLLAPGKCGAMPPIAHWYGPVGGYVAGSDAAILAKGCRWRDSTDPTRGLPTARALVLAWGEPVPEGCDRVLRLCGYNQDRAYTLDDAEHFARLGAKRLGGDVVVIEGWKP